MPLTKLILHLVLGSHATISAMQQQTFIFLIHHLQKFIKIQRNDFYIHYHLDWSSGRVSGWHFGFDPIRKSGCPHFQPDPSRVEHISIPTRRDPTRPAKDPSLTSRGLNIEIQTPLAYFSIIFDWHFLGSPQAHTRNGPIRWGTPATFRLFQVLFPEKYVLDPTEY